MNKSIVALGIIVIALGILITYFLLHKVTVPPWGPSYYVWVLVAGFVLILWGIASKREKQ